jgi:uncharacterized Zn finger protein (UPF0148 family)
MKKTEERDRLEQETGETLCPVCGSTKIEEDGQLICPSCDAKIDFFGEDDDDDTK